MQNLFELELRTAVREQLYTNRTADIHSTVSYQPTKPTTQRDHLGLQILKKNETQTRPKRDPNAEVLINISDWFSHVWSPNPENSMKNLDPKRKYMIH